MRARKANISKGLVAGAIAGLAASFAMNQFQALWSKAAEAISDGGQQSGGEGENATVKTAQAISKQVRGRELDESEKKPAGAMVHYAFGTCVGALYGALAEAMPISRAGCGTVYGGAVWLGADEFFLPAVGLSGPPTESPLPIHVNALASHLVYGLVTDLVRRGIIWVGSAD